MTHYIYKTTMEQKNIFNTLQKTPDYMILLYTKYLDGKENPDFTPLDYKQQIDAKTDISKIVYFLSSNIWEDDAKDNITEVRAKTLLRYVLISRLADYIENDPLTVEKFRIEYNQEFRPMRLIIVDNYNKHFRGDQGLKQQIYYTNPELRKKWNELDYFIKRAYKKLHRKDMTAEQKEYYINNVEWKKPADKTRYDSNGADRQKTKCSDEYEHLRESLEQRLKLQYNQIINCECDGTYSNKTRLKHVRTTRHQNYIKRKMDELSL